MSKFFRSLFIGMLLCSMGVWAQQLPDPHFEDWSGASFSDNVQPKYWHGSNVEQVGLKFNFTYREAGRSGYSVMVKDQEVGAMGITEVGPGYFSLGEAWQYLSGLSTGTATAGTVGGISFTYRPDSVSVWIKRTGDHTADEDFHILFYSWVGQTKGDKYKNKDGGCQATTRYDEESDIRQALDGNECGTAVKGTQVAEGWLYDRKYYGEWTNIRIPIYYINNTKPEKCNMLFSASNYPNFRANSGLYKGNAIYVDDVELIYSSKIQTLYVGGKEWKGFDPNSTAVQVYSLGENATAIPELEAMRGAGTLTNLKGTTVAFPGRKLSGSEISIVNGDLESKPTKITVKSEDGKSTTVYQIQFQKAASSNAKLANILVNGTSVAGFSPTKYNYTVDLPFGTTTTPVVTAEGQEDGQTIAITQPTSPTGTAKIVVTAANKSTTASYSLEFRVAALADNTLADIKVNGKSVAGFTPAQTIYRVSLPENTTSMPKVEAISAYPAGAQTITYTAPSVIDGGQYQISVTTPGNPVAKVYKLNFKLEKSSYTYLQDLKVGGVTVDGFEPTKLTYSVHLPMGTTELPVITWTPGDEFQKVELTSLGAGVVDGTVTITVTAGNGEQSRYRIIFSTDKSSISTLNMIYLNGQPLEGFSADKKEYTVSLPIGTTALPEITWEQGDAYQTVVPTLGGLNGKTRITVTAGDGSTTVYQITFSVQLATNATLNSIKVGGVELPDFDPNVFEYSYSLPMGTTTLPEVTYEQHDEFQTITVRNGGINGDYKITVRPQSGNSNTYIIHFSVATSSNTALKMIYLDGTPLEDFDPEVKDYEVNLPEGISKIPAVTFDKGESTQRVLSVLENKVQTITVTAESGAKRVYTLTFNIVVSENAFLNMIYLNGDSLEGFLSSKLDYTLPLSTATCPVITVDKAPGQQVTITAPYAAGVATILVKPESGAANTYTITFEAAAPVTVRLADILIDGVSLAGFSALKSHYTLNYEKSLPKVQGLPESEDQTVSVLWKGEEAWIQVSDKAGNKASYTIAFTREISANAQLQAILMDGAPLATFDPAVLSYNIDLAAGSSYPEVGYQVSDEAQVVFFGQVAEGKWAITVMAENATKQTYTIQFHIAQYDDALLENLQVAGQTITFDPLTYLYEFTIAKGASLPDVSVTAKAGQTVLVFNAGENEQKIIVTAESGATNTYVLSYSREISTDALLADILIDGQSLAGFESDTYDYVDTIAWRSKVVPNVFPVARNNYQTITTTYGRPNGTTRIHVVAQSGAEADYTIAFPVRQSSNVALADLYLNSEEVEINFKPNVTNYVVEMPYQATACPTVVYEAAEPEQRVDVISRPLGDTTQITVVAENGDTRTYSIYFKETPAKEANRLSMIRVRIDNDEEQEQELSLKDKTQRDFVVAVPFGSRAFTVEYEKMYPEQTVFVQPGGVHHPTILTVKANRPDEADEVYTITPNMPTSDPAVLTEIKINGTPIENFNPEQFSYVVNVTSKPILRYSVNKGAEINILDQSTKHWQAEVTYGTRTNTYDVWYYYPAEQVPNSEFTEWTTTTTGYVGAVKPVGWNGVADALNTDKYRPVLVEYTFEPNELVVNENDDIVDLHTRYSWPGGGDIPAFITLGNVAGTWGRFGASSFDVTGGISFHNSPDTMKIKYQSIKINDQNGNDNKHNQIQYRLSGMDGDTTLEWRNYSTTKDYDIYTYDLSSANSIAGAPTTMNIVLNSNYVISSTNSTNAPTGTNAQMKVDWIRFSYNHTLASLKVDAFTADKNGTAFSVTLTDPERIEKPVLTFTGEVKDQAQLVTWDTAEKIEGKNAVRNAKIRNFAENGIDYTDYTLSVRRPLDNRNQLSTLIIDGDTLKTFLPATKSYTVNLPSTRRHLPDIVPVPASSLQTVTTSFADSTMTITVTPEYGSATVYTVKFVTDLSDDTTLATITAEGITFDPAVHAYEVKADYLPLITFAKNHDGQIVRLQNGVLTVTAENGAVGTYTITRQNPTYTAYGVIAEFTENGNIITGFGGTNYIRQAARPENAISFVREAAVDSVIFIQTKDSMIWRAIGTTEEHSYKWEYPVALSSNTKLRMIRVDGVDYTAFDPEENTYIIPADTIKQVETVADEGQTLQVSQSAVAGGFAYAVKVKAENGDENTYSISVQKPLSSVATLSGILLDSVLIPNFHPDTMSYVVTLPAPAVKTTKPQMPSVTYIAGQAGQTVEMEPAGLGEQIIFTVHSEDGTLTKDYYLTVVAAPSACKDLTGIIVNGETIDQFEPGRHYYSVTIKSNTVNVDCTSDDRFQTVKILVDTIKPEQQFNYTLRVFAENGDSTQYEVMVYVENASSDAQLANITLNGKNFVDFERALNPDLTFDPANNSYKINLPSGTTILPEVSAQLKMEGQSVDITQKDKAVLLTVTAVDGKATITYTLNFLVPLSTNANLSMIYLNGDSLKGFTPDYYFYQVELPVGVHTLPEVVGQKGEAWQTLQPVEINTKNNRATITVTAENPTFSNQYVISFRFNKSDADTLAMLYADGEPLKDFAPTTFRYNYELPVGTDAFPDLSWDEADEWQNIRMDTIEQTTEKLRREVTVVAESGLKNIYAVSYTILKSTVDTLRAILINNKEMADFKADSMEYYYPLSIEQVADLNGNMPTVAYTEGDEYQTVKVEEKEDPNADKMKCLSHKSIITVTADAGNKRVYTIHYPIELSSERLLDMIYVAGDSLPNFDKENPSYTLSIEQTAAVPVVTWTKHEELQTVHPTYGHDTVRLHVTAENGEQMMYTIAFQRKKSDVTLLRDIVLTDAEGEQLSTGLFAFRPEIPDYNIVLPYDPTGADILPTITYDVYDTLQTVTRQDHDLPNGDVMVAIHVLAPNEEDEAEYNLTFHFMRNNDARVNNILINGATISGFDSETTEYEYRLPYGSDESAFITLDQVSYILSDALARDTCYTDDDKTIFIRIVAQDGTTERTYIIRQYVGLDDDCSLATIELDGVEIEDFDSDITFYTYQLWDGQNPPMVTAEARSENADVSIRAVSAGDTCTILCTAMDGSEKRYYIHFEIAAINTDTTATAGSVLMKRVPGEPKLFVATIRKDVTFYLFHQDGHLMFSAPVPVADPNDVDVYIDLNGEEVLNNVTASGLEVDINLGQIYFYAFRSSEKVIQSGKIIGLP